MGNINDLIHQAETGQRRVEVAVNDTLGSAVRSIVGSISSAATFGYVCMSLVYGPYDAGVVALSETRQFARNDATMKHRVVVEAQGLYALKLGKTELTSQDLKMLYLELNVVPVAGVAPSEKDVSWYRLLDWIEDNG